MFGTHCGAAFLCTRKRCGYWCYRFMRQGWRIASIAIAGYEQPDSFMRMTLMIGTGYPIIRAAGCRFCSARQE